MGCGPHSCLATFLAPPNLIEPPVHTRTNSLPSSWGVRTQHETNKKVIAVSGRERIDNQSVVLVVQSCPTFCNPMDCSLPGYPVLGILQKNTGVDSDSLLQGISLTHGSNLGLLPCRHSLPSDHQQSPDNKQGRAKDVSRDSVLSNFYDGGIMNQCGKTMEEAD